MKHQKKIIRSAGRMILVIALVITVIFGGTVPALAGTGASPVTLGLENALTTVSIPYSGTGSFTIKVNCENTDSAAHSVKVVPDLTACGTTVSLSGVSPSGANTTGLSISSTTDLKSVTFTFKVTGASTTASYSIPFTLTDENGKTSGVTATALLAVQQYIPDTSVYDDDSSSVTVTYKPAMTMTFSVPDNDGVLVVEKENRLTVTATNTGDCVLSNAEIQLGTLPTGIAIYNSTDRKQLGTLQKTTSSSKTSSGTATFQIDIQDTVESGIYPFPITMSGYDPNGSKYSVTETLYLKVSGNDTPKPVETTDLKTPILMVSSYSQSANALAGTTFGLNLTVKNTSEATLRNIKVVVGDGGGVFVPSGSSNAYYIATVAGGATDTHTINLTVNRDAAQTTTPVTVSMTYEDANGNSYSATDTIAIPVIQETRFVVDTMEAITYAWVNETVSSSIQFYNMGRNTISNVKVTVSGDFTVTKNGSVFVGNMASGSSSTVKFNLMPVNVGTNSGVITFTYDDATGNTLTQEVPFTFEAQGYTEVDTGEYEDIGYYEEPVVEKTLPWKWIGIGGAALLVVVLLILRSVKKKKAAKALELEFEDEPKEKEGK